jgi:hypothetical protein
MILLSAFEHIGFGLTILSSAFEYEDERYQRFLDNRVIIWLIKHVSLITDTRVINIDQAALRWRENVELWHAKNFSTIAYDVIHRKSTALWARKLQQAQTSSSVAGRRSRSSEVRAHMCAKVNETNKPKIRGGRNIPTERHSRRTTRPDRFDPPFGDDFDPDDQP